MRTSRAGGGALLLARDQRQGASADHGDVDDGWDGVDDNNGDDFCVLYDDDDGLDYHGW